METTAALPKGLQPAGGAGQPCAAFTMIRDSRAK